MTVKFHPVVPQPFMSSKPLSAPRLNFGGFVYGRVPLFIDDDKKKVGFVLEEPVMVA